MIPITKIYIRKILAGTMLWTDVPSLWQNKVKAELERQGYICNDDGTVSRADGSDLFSAEVPTEAI